MQAVLWYLAFAGFLTLLLPANRTRERLFAIFFVLFSFLPTVPGYYFRPG